MFRTTSRRPALLKLAWVKQLMHSCCGYVIGHAAVNIKPELVLIDAQFPFLHLTQKSAVNIRPHVEIIRNGEQRG